MATSSVNTRLRSSPDGDMFNTPYAAIPPLLPFLYKYKGDKGKPFKWLEPATTKGDDKTRNIVKCLRANQFSTVESYCDFFSDEFEKKFLGKFDGIITNPPYSQKYKWLKRCYELNVPFALLLPVQSVASVAMLPYWKGSAPDMLVYARRVDFMGKGNATFSVAWYMHQTRLQGMKVVAGPPLGTVITLEKKIRDTTNDLAVLQVSITALEGEIADQAAEVCMLRENPDSKDEHIEIEQSRLDELNAKLCELTDAQTTLKHTCLVLRKKKEALGA